MTKGIPPDYEVNKSRVGRLRKCVLGYNVGGIYGYSTTLLSICIGATSGTACYFCAQHSHIIYHRPNPKVTWSSYSITWLISYYYYSYILIKLLHTHQVTIRTAPQSQHRCEQQTCVRNVLTMCWWRWADHVQPWTSICQLQAKEWDMTASYRRL